MKLKNLIYEVEDPVREGDVFLNKRNGEVLLITSYRGSKERRVWNGVEFNLKPRYGDPYLSSGSFTSTWAAMEKMYKKIKLTSKDKKIIQKILKDPESVDRLGQVGTRVKDIERYIR